ncbi:MAG: adenylyl-sulfate kinase [Verrucomicrobia bacterium]|nr:adenylyl-sulfate kinase [Verrucomicrobiota bacterium]
MSTVECPKTMIFLTGYSGAGKSTIAEELLTKLQGSIVLDGDKVRAAYGNDTPHGRDGSKVNAERLVELALKNFKSTTYVITAFVAPREDLREYVKKTITDKDIQFIEVYISAKIETCQARDPKGLYAKQKKGQHILLAGLTTTYDIPKAPDLICDTDENTSAQCAAQIINKLREKSTTSEQRQWSLGTTALASLFSFLLVTLFLMRHHFLRSIKTF